MKNYFIKNILAVLGLIVSILSFAQTATENYVQSKNCLTADCNRKSETITYFDGLGRAKQIISVKATPSGKDLVTPVVYDGFGRQIKNILPVPAQTQNSNIHTGITNENAANSYYGVNNAYTEKQVENSPLDRILQQAQPGESWVMSSGNTEKFEYEVNKVNEVKKFITTTSINTVNNISNTVSQVSVSSDNSGCYAAGVLYKNTVTDEDGNPVTEYKNGRGQTVLVRRTDGTQSIDTYYVYNEYNQLAFVITPKAVKKIELNNNVVTDGILNELCYQYRYDGQNRNVEKRLPGQDWTLMIYDQQDRPVLVQDGNLRTTTNNFNGKGWIFTKYDELGRVVYTGFFSNTANRQAMQNALNSMAANPYNNEKRSAVPFNLAGVNVFYDKKAFPTGSMTILTINYYDTYPEGAESFSSIQGQYTLSPVLGSNDDASTKGLQTASLVRNVENDQWTRTYMYYDSKGRIISTRSTNHLGGYTNTETKLNFSGLADETYTNHRRTRVSQEIRVKERFIYDDQNRLLQHFHQVDSKPEELLAENTYNDLSQLTNKKIGNNFGTPLQSVDYTYNIRGWLTSINNPSNLGDDLFGMKIKYENPEDPDYGIAKYNGNISEIDWKTQLGDGNYRRYSYKYDPLNRLTDGIYLTPFLAANTQNHYYDEQLSYDANGNIKTLNRFKNPPAGQNTPLQIDELTYEFGSSDISNKLIKVTDAKANSYGYPTGGNLMGYDVNGNMTSQPDKGISLIKYNYLNLPAQVLSSQGNTSYIYRADGTKAQKIFGSTTTDYLDGFQYENEKLKFFPTAEGFYNAERGEYVYNYTDHLGNVRLSYNAADGGGIAVLEESNYYPFGLKHQGYNDGSLLNDFGTNYNYKYNGKELQETGMYDYGARFYMPDIGRWGVVDPAAELGRRFSPYNYAFDNPIMFVDPDGMWPWPTWNQVKKFAGGYAKGAWSTAANMVKGTLTSNYTGITGGFREAGKVYKAYKSGGIKAAANQYVQSVYETSGAKTLVQTAKGVAKGDAESIGSAVVTIAAAVVTHKAAGAAKAGGRVAATETSTMNELTNAVKEKATQLKESKQFVATVSGAELNGQTIVATSGNAPSTIAPQLEAAINELGGLNTLNENSGTRVGCCSEFHGGNKLLLDNPSATPGQINFTDAIRPRNGKVIPMCENCKRTFDR